MKIITAPQETALYPGLVASTIMEVRMKLGMSRIHLNYLAIHTLCTVTLSGPDHGVRHYCRRHWMKWRYEPHHEIRRLV